MNAAIAYLLIMLICAAGWHFAVKRYAFAVMGSTLTIILLFQIAVIFSAGYFDPFFTSALAALGIMGAMISFIMGIPFLLWRKTRKH